MVATASIVSAQKKLFFKLRRTKAEVSALEDGDLHSEHTAMIVARLGVQENDVVEMNRRLSGDVSLNTAVHADEPGELQDLLVDPAASPETVHAEHEEVSQRRQALAAALNASILASGVIFEARYMSEPSVRLEDLSNKYGISHERVRQIEIRAFEKVRAAVCACMTKARRVEQQQAERPNRAPKSRIHRGQ